MIYGLVIAVHAVACLILIAVILLQAGRGGGLSEAFGGESGQTIFGTKASVFLSRATVVAACMYLVTCLALGILTSRRGRSLVDLQGTQPIPATIPLVPPGEEEVAREAEEKVIDKEDIPLAKPEELPQE